MRAAQGDHLVHFPGQAQILQRITGERPTHGMTDQVGFFGAGGIEDTLHMIDHLLGQLAGIDVRRGIAH